MKEELKVMHNTDSKQTNETRQVKQLANQNQTFTDGLSVSGKTEDEAQLNVFTLPLDDIDDEVSA